MMIKHDYSILIFCLFVQNVGAGLASYTSAPW
jgi:hypothetical protein